MFFNPESLYTNIFVTILVIIMVFVMPWVDRKICRRLGISISDGISANPEADHLLKLRKVILILIFMIYLGAVAYVTFLSRSASADYRVNGTELFRDFRKSFYIDFGMLDILNIFFTEGPRSALEHIHIVSGGGIAQVYMNVAMLVPMGYLLPYIFDWFRRDVSRRTIPACFLTSVLIENIQLLSRHGLYDLDDIITNTTGGIIGQALFIAVAYINTHPHWRREVKARKKWRRSARKTAVYPFMNRIHMTRSTVYTCDEEGTRSFLGDQLGFFLYDEKKDENGTRLLYECKGTEIEVICLPKGSKIPAQQITIAANNSERIRRRLEKYEIQVSEYAEDEYTGLRTFSIESPDGLRVVFIEE
jgi:glycopeptide antibiotics resistance protein